MNPFLILSGIGMMLVGILPPIYWQKKKSIEPKYFLFGGAVWFIAILVKLVMDLTITELLNNFLLSTFSISGAIVLIGAYVGLRTGILENGFTYVAAVKTRLKNMEFDHLFAFALGFGCTEAFLIGLSSFLNVLVFLIYPSALNLIHEPQRTFVLNQLSQPTIIIFAPIIERVFTLFVHIFTIFLVFLAVRSGKTRYFALSVLYKTLPDGMLPWLTRTFDTNTISGIYSIEIFVMLFGVVALRGAWWAKHVFSEMREQPVRKFHPKRDVFFLMIVIILVIEISLLISAINAKVSMDRRIINLNDFRGRYTFLMRNKTIGYNEFRVINKTTIMNIPVYQIQEKTNLTFGNTSLLINGNLFITKDVRPTYHEYEIRTGDVSKRYVSEFSGDKVHEIIYINGKEHEKTIPISNDTFILTNNIIGQWALIFQVLPLRLNEEYDVDIFDPSEGRTDKFVIKVDGMENILIGKKLYKVYRLDGNFSDVQHTFYVTLDGVLVKMKNPEIEIILGA